MSRSLEAAIETARARAVPWDAERSARVERSIGASRMRSGLMARFALTAPLARWALGGLASVVLYASLSRVAQLSGEGGVSAERFEEPAPRFTAPPLPIPPAGEPAEEDALAERPVGDGGFD
jgi:hypothetical protein